MDMTWSHYCFNFAFPWSFNKLNMFPYINQLDFLTCALPVYILCLFSRGLRFFFLWLTYWISFTFRILKIPDAGKAWGQEKKEDKEDEMVGWHYWVNGHEYEQTPGDSKGQGNLLCCSPCCHKESDMTEQLNNIYIYLIPNILLSLS